MAPRGRELAQVELGQAGAKQLLGVAARGRGSRRLPVLAAPLVEREPPRLPALEHAASPSRTSALLLLRLLHRRGLHVRPLSGSARLRPPPAPQCTAPPGRSGSGGACRAGSGSRRG